MFSMTRGWRVFAGGAAAGIAGVMGFAGATAAAEPIVPGPPTPVPTPVTVSVDPAAVTTGVTPIPSTVPLTPSSQLTQTALTPQTALQPVQAAPVQAAPTPALIPATSGTLRDYFADKGVTLEAQNPREFRALMITLPMPTGWTQVPDPNVPDAYAVIADRVGGDGLYTSNAQVVIYKLVGSFDPTEAITHGFVDSQQLANWQTTDASLAPFGGFPSAQIEGTYRENDMALNTSRRHVIATSGDDRYLVSLSVTTAVNQAVATADATDAIVNGFRVTDPAAVAVTPAPVVAPPAAAAAPALPAPVAPTG
ncbi:LpqN/LpqT family lipoprotein [Mycobacterium sp. ACS4331]|uniref:LpqN/LpqT family lipoprotein n=1 Tax=Mycobacterium sp. ACS4331 TaxID=1834121 RepID=UPI0008006BFC|nr:LpqN/LpqT family lipoprotein [Mycobacterium sp. ACS4331]OBF13760.1 hypothetical protein A5727_17065 [Mycobacterium sp. ACS4331]